MDNTSQVPQTQDPTNTTTWGTSLWDEKNPYAMVNRLPEELKQRLLDAKEIAPDLFSLDDRTLLSTLKSRNLPLAVLDNRLRIALWMDYDRSIVQNRVISAHSIYNGFCTFEAFYKRLEEPHRVAWIFSPPAKYEKIIEEALVYGLEQLRVVLEEDPMKDGKLNLPLMKLKMSIVVMLDQRQKGGYVQKIEEKRLNLHAGISGSDLSQITSMADMDKKIAELEMQLQKKSGGSLQQKRQPRPIDVPPEPVPMNKRYAK